MSGQNELTPVLAFGWKPDVVGNGVLLADNRLCYIANKLLVIQNDVDQSQELAQCDETGLSTAMALSNNRRLVAVSQYFVARKPIVELFTVPFSKKTILTADIIDAKA
jgi:hypothetical protein